MEPPFICDPISICIQIQIHIQNFFFFLNSGYLRKLLKPNEFMAICYKLKLATIDCRRLKYSRDFLNLIF